MGLGISKKSLEKNTTSLTKLNDEINKTMSGILEKYGELVHEDIDKYYQELQLAIVNGTKLPELPSFQMFDNTCKSKLIMSFGSKLKKFPKYVLEKKGGFLGIGGKKMYANINIKPDKYDITKDELCNEITQFYMDLLNLIEIVSYSFFTCQNNLEFIAKEKLAKAGDVKTNSAFFKKIAELQKVYKKHTSNIKSLFKKLSNLEEVNSEFMLKLSTKISKQVNEMSNLPNQCNNMAQEINNFIIIDEKTAEMCKQLKISSSKCTVAEVEKKRVELEAKNRATASSQRPMYTNSNTRFNSNVDPRQQINNLSNNISSSVQNNVAPLQRAQNMLRQQRGGGRKKKYKKKIKI